MDPSVLPAYRFARAHLRGVLRFDEHVRDFSVVFAPDGRLVGPVMVAMIEAADCVLHLPDERPPEEDGAIEVMVTLEQFDERGPKGHLSDRWCAYHGEPADVRWAILSIEAARFAGLFIDGVAMTIPNPLAPSEPALCKAINARRDDLRAAVQRTSGVLAEAPVLVGVDPYGFDVRGQFVIHRVPVDAPMHDAASVVRSFDALVRR